MIYTLVDFNRDLQILVKKITDSGKSYKGIYPLPRGGMILGMALSSLLGISLVDSLAKDILVVDDIIDSGQTRRKYIEFDFACLHITENKMTETVETIQDNFLTKTNKKAGDCFFITIVNEWVEYFWEGQDAKNKDIEQLITRMIEIIGEDPCRHGLIETPKRINKSWEFLFSGYTQDVSQLFTKFEGEGYNQIILLKDIEMYSMCEHHMLPFFGKAHIAYIPDKHIIGISKLARILNIYSRRMQIQERIGDQVTDALMKYLSPLGAACIIEANHLCMRMRGVEKQNSIMTTSSLKGVFLDNIASREELLRLIK